MSLNGKQGQPSVQKESLFTKSFISSYLVHFADEKTGLDKSSHPLWEWAVAHSPEVTCFKIVHMPIVKILFFLIYVFFFLSFFAVPLCMEFLGQGSYASHSCDLHCSHSNIGYLTHFSGPGIKPEPCHWRDTTDPTVPQWDLQDTIF